MSLFGYSPMTRFTSRRNKISQNFVKKTICYMTRYSAYRMWFGVHFKEISLLLGEILQISVIILSDVLVSYSKFEGNNYADHYFRLSFNLRTFWFELLACTSANQINFPLSFCINHCY